MIRSRRRVLQGGLARAGVGLLAGCGLVSSPGERATGLRRIAYLEAGTGESAFEVFRARLRDFGYVEGQNLSIEHRNAEGKLERLPAMAAEVVELHVEII